MLKLQSALRTAAVVLVALCSYACGPAPRPAVNLDPRRVAASQGAMFGRLAITNEGETVTEGCYVFFTDDRMAYKTHLDLDASGWVFAELRSGRTHLTEVRCVVGGFIKHVAQYRTQTVAFDVPGNGQLTYFGHVTIELDTGDTPAVLGAAIGGLAGALVSDIDATGKQSLYVDNKIGEASRELKSRFRGGGGALKVLDGVGGPSDISKRAPRNPNLLVATSDLGGVKLLWLGRPKLDASTVGLRFQRFGTKPELATCTELVLSLDGVSSRHPLKYKATQAQTIVQEAAQAVVPIETIRALAAARNVELDLCGDKRKLSPQATDDGRAFLADFDRRSPPPVPVPVPVPVPAPAVANEQAAASVTPLQEPATAALEPK